MMIPGLGHTLSGGSGGGVPSFPPHSPPTTAQRLPTVNRAPPKPVCGGEKKRKKKSPTSMVVRILQHGIPFQDSLPKPQNLWIWGTTPPTIRLCWMAHLTLREIIQLALKSRVLSLAGGRRGRWRDSKQKGNWSVCPVSMGLLGTLFIDCFFFLSTGCISFFYMSHNFCWTYM